MLIHDVRRVKPQPLPNIPVGVLDEQWQTKQQMREIFEELELAERQWELTKYDEVELTTELYNRGIELEYVEYAYRSLDGVSGATQNLREYL